ncbi:hypothetical protein Tco_1185480 [Tanacetum coccineum]
MSSIGFSTVKTASTLMETSKPLLKDVEAEDVDVHLYRSMIGSLMYLTALRPDIIFAICACARFQVTPKVSHLHAMKRIFRYLKGQPKLGLWYPKNLPFNLEAYTDSDYAGASLDRNPTNKGCLEWNGTAAKDEIQVSAVRVTYYYALTVNPIIYTTCIEQFWETTKVKTINGERQIQALVDKKRVIITEKSVRSDLMLEDAKGTECLPNDVIFE